MPGASEKLCKDWSPLANAFQTLSQHRRFGYRELRFFFQRHNRLAFTRHEHVDR